MVGVGMENTQDGNPQAFGELLTLQVILRAELVAVVARLCFPGIVQRQDFFHLVE